MLCRDRFVVVNALLGNWVGLELSWCCVDFMSLSVAMLVFVSMRRSPIVLKGAFSYLEYMYGVDGGYAVWAVYRMRCFLRWQRSIYVSVLCCRGGYVWKWGCCHVL